MQFLKNLFWRFTPVELGPKGIMTIIAVVVLMTGIVWFEGKWRVDSCEVPLQRAESELSEAFQKVRSAGELKVRDDPACPAYRNFIQIAERASEVFQRCRSRPARHDISTADIPGYTASIKKRAAEYCSTP